MTTQLLTVEQVAEQVHLSRETVIGYLKSGEIPGMVRIGPRRILVNARIFDEHLNRSALTQAEVSA